MLAALTTHARLVLDPRRHLCTSPTAAASPPVASRLGAICSLSHVWAPSRPRSGNGAWLPALAVGPHEDRGACVRFGPRRGWSVPTELPGRAGMTRGPISLIRHARLAHIWADRHERTWPGSPAITDPRNPFATRILVVVCPPTGLASHRPSPWHSRSFDHGRPRLCPALPSPCSGGR
ncbi:hypothetical protein DB30_04374 [Enhygromyxa salina]|uniref:Uncharacterized protein n=1 Tax=Enhygromyxa salina TaxID=215803 RepID=A0A0C2CZQ4_9BACT|nr:hypothetical protein DB30_04374 [Enhygromyxa salina]